MESHYSLVWKPTIPIKLIALCLYIACLYSIFYYLMIHDPPKLTNSIQNDEEHYFPMVCDFPFS
jgi:hypothetical protein